MIDVEPMPNELCLAHEGRLVWINGCVSPKEATILICSTLAERGFDPVGLPRLHRLALVSDMSPCDYARQHSMLPAIRVAAKPGEDKQHGAADALGYARTLGMLTQRRGAHCCIKCIEEDLQRHRRSWFRRTHHLIGVDWCPVHDCVLSRVDAPEPFSRVPHRWLAEDKLIPVDACQNQLPADGFLRRYVEIATALLERDRPAHAETVNVRLAQRAKTLGLRISKTGQRPLISDRLIELAPAQWLRQHLSNSDLKTPLAYFQRIDALVAMKTCVGAGEAYAMAMAALYDSSEAALLDFTRADTGNTNAIQKVKQAKRGTKFWHGEIWPHYLESHGRPKLMAESLGIDPKLLGQMLSDLGLPSLHGLDHSATWRAFMRFCDGQTLSDSCALEQAESVELEKLLRKCSARPYAAVKKIRTISTGEGRKALGFRSPRLASAKTSDAQNAARAETNCDAANDEIEQIQRIHSI